MEVFKGVFVALTIQAAVVLTVVAVVMAVGS